MSEALRLAEIAKEKSKLLGELPKRIDFIESDIDFFNTLSTELRRLAAVEQELEALKRAICDAAPVAWLATGIASGLPQAVAFSSDDATDMSVNCLTQPLYTLKGIIK